MCPRSISRRAGFTISTIAFGAASSSRCEGLWSISQADSGYGTHFAEIGRRYRRIDLALLPIGAYEPRWFTRQIHVDPQEAVRAHLDLKPRRSLGMHFGTFQLTDEAIDAPVLALRQAQARVGVAKQDFDVLGFGETREYSGA
jgi:L-ascorbate metabolism protein UlaG (beta-lactamase superfamily)